METLGQRIKLERKKKKISQSELGRLCGNYTPMAVSSWERDVFEPDMTTLARLAGIFNMPLSELMLGAADVSEPAIIAQLRARIKQLEEENRQQKEEIDKRNKTITKFGNILKQAGN